MNADQVRLEFESLRMHIIDQMRFPVKSVQDLMIEDLQAENEAAFQLIQRLSRALYDLGYDPTRLP